MKLIDLPLFFLDLQTTGAKPDNSNILEMAWGDREKVTSFLVAQPEGAGVPRRIQMVTGISDDDMTEARELSDVLTDFNQFIAQWDDPVCVIHFAQFERPFLKAAFQTEDLPFPILCTNEIAKRLYPNLPSRGIKALAGFFGNNSGDFKRGHGHIEATQKIWENLVPALAEKGITTLDELRQWLQETPKAARTKYEYPLPKEKRLNLPDVPGIYRMLNSKGEVLYVGKATSLFSRVNSYFRGQKNRNSFKLEMLAQVYDLRVTECGSPLEAALMETDEIKRLNPYYNIALKVGYRSLVFFDRDFSSMSEVADDEHFIGPFSSMLVFHSTMKLLSFIHNRFEDDNALPDEDLFHEVLDQELIKAGLDLFCARHEFSLLDISSMRKIMAIGLIWDHRLKLQEEVENEIEADDEEVAEEDIPLTAEDIADKFERHFMRVGRSYIKARKMSALLDADILFNEKDSPEATLMIRKGKIFRGEIENVEENPWATTPIETYDRLTVLLTELNRVKSQEGNFKITYLA